MSTDKDTVVGRVKQAAADLTDDEDLEREGERQEAAGEAKDKIDEAADKLRDGVDRLEEKLR